MASILFLTLSVLLLLKVAAIELIDPPDGYEFAVGEPTTIRWKPVASNGTVTLEFMWGAAIASDDGDVIACSSDMLFLIYLPRLMCRISPLTTYSRNPGLRTLYMDSAGRCRGFRQLHHMHIP